MNFHLFAQDVLLSLPVREKTRKNYQSMYRCHIEARLGSKLVMDVHRSEIQNLIVNLPAQTSLMTLAVLKTIFREAIAREIVEHSPVDGVKTPKLNLSPRKFLTWTEIQEGEFGAYKSQIKFLALHGLRWGEAVVLTHSDIRNGRIYINKSIHGPTKSQSGNRVIPYIGGFEPLPKSPKTLAKVLKPHGVHIHSLRHSYAYLLKTQGVHVTTAQRFMGHSDPNITLKIYTQVLDNEIELAGELLSRVC